MAVVTRKTAPCEYADIFERERPAEDTVAEPEVGGGFGREYEEAPVVFARVYALAQLLWSG